MNTTMPRELWTEPTPEAPSIDDCRDRIQQAARCGPFTAHIAAWRLEQEQAS